MLESQVTELNIRRGWRDNACDQVYFSYAGKKYVANIKKLVGDNNFTPRLYVFGKPGDACITTKEINDPKLLSEIIKIANQESN